VVAFVAEFPWNGRSWNGLVLPITRRTQIPIAPTARTLVSLTAVSFPGGFRTTAPMPAALSSWAVVRNPSQQLPYPRRHGRATGRARPQGVTAAQQITSDVVSDSYRRSLFRQEAPANSAYPWSTRPDLAEGIWGRKIRQRPCRSGEVALQAPNTNWSRSAGKNKRLRGNRSQNRE